MTQVMVSQPLSEWGLELYVVYCAVRSSIDDSPEEAAKKYAILGRCLRSVKEHTKEALKSVQMGSDGAAYLIMEGQKHHPLDNFVQVSLTEPDGDRAPDRLNDGE